MSEQKKVFLCSEAVFLLCAAESRESRGCASGLPAPPTSGSAVQSAAEASVWSAQETRAEREEEETGPSGEGCDSHKSVERGVDGRSHYTSETSIHPHRNDEHGSKALEWPGNVEPVHGVAPRAGKSGSCPAQRRVLGQGAQRFYVL